MTDEEIQLQKRLIELSAKCQSSNIYTYSGFLSLGEQEVLHKSVSKLSCRNFELLGGYDEAERRIVRFGTKDELWYEEDIPISCIVIKPLSAKFADNLSHRDILGAVMNLGIERRLVGDIIVKENEYCLFCLNSIAEYIVDSLTRIRHTSINCEITESVPDGVGPVLQDVRLVVSSTRCDGVISKVFHVSRSESESLINRELVFVNGRRVQKCSVTLSEDDVVSVRGYGKFKLSELGSETRKGNLSIVVKKYI